MNGRLEILTEQDLLILRDHLMSHNILNAENVPDGIGQRLAVVPLRPGEGHLVKRLLRKSAHDLRDLLKQALAQLQQF